MKDNKALARGRKSFSLDESRVAVLGMESVGKSSLLSALSRRFAESSALAGTTIRCEYYDDGTRRWIDTPGIISGSDAVTVREALSAIDTVDSILLVLRADRAKDQLDVLWPLLGQRKVAVALTFRDRLSEMDARMEETLLETWKKRLQVPLVLLDGRKPTALELAGLRTAIDAAAPLLDARIDELPSFSERPRPRLGVIIERILGFAPISLFLLFGPAWLAVTQANALADRFYDPVEVILAGTLTWLNSLPAPLAATLGGEYGIVAMFPFLLLYALPTILIFTGLIAIYKSTGLIDRLSYGLHPWLRPFGLGGRDLVRIVMGFGCNVPAVVATRSCSSCSRGACVSAISFGSACSYQLPATLAVFAAAGYVWLGPVYLALLAATTLIYLRLTTPTALRLAQNTILLPALGHLRPPHWGSVFREIIQSLRDFLVMAFPIFIGICVIAGLLQWSGLLKILTSASAPVMTLFNLPPEAALAVVLGSVRKDGLAIGLLNGDWDSLKVPVDSPIQVLTAVYLAGVLLPCLVTVLTVAKEMRPRFALKLVGRQAAFAVVFSLLIAWGGAYLF